MRKPNPGEMYFSAGQRDFAACLTYIYWSGAFIRVFYHD